MGGAERRRRVELREVEQVFAQGSSRRDAVDVPRQHRILEEPLPELASIRTEEESFSPSTSLPFILSAPASRLPKCDKIMLYTFKNWWGFGSEYLLYVSFHRSDSPGLASRKRVELTLFMHSLTNS